MSRKCYCGAFREKHAECIKGDSCPRRAEGKGQWHLALPKLVAMGYEARAQRYPELDLNAVIEHVDRFSGPPKKRQRRDSERTPRRWTSRISREGNRSPGGDHPAVYNDYLQQEASSSSQAVKMEPATPEALPLRHPGQEQEEESATRHLHVSVPHLLNEKMHATGVATEHAFHDIAVGPCRLRCTNNELGTICKMQEEINLRFTMPVSLEELLQKYENPRCDADLHRGKSLSGIIEAISRCTTAFQKANDATEHIECQDIAAKTCDYAIALTRKTSAYCGHSDSLILIHEFIKNRTYNLAFTDLLNRALPDQYDDPFWSHVAHSSAHCAPHKEECLRIIETCMDAIKNHADDLRLEMEVYRLSLP